MTTPPNGLNRWQGKRCFVLTPGASLTQNDVNAIQGQGRMIAVNKAYQRAMFADALFSMDGVFWEQMSYEINQSGFPGERWTTSTCRATRTYDLNVYPAINSNIKGNGTVTELGVNQERLLHIAGSGGTAINLAYAFGCNPIVLLGFDMQYVDGRVHFHADYKRSSNPNKHRFERWKKEMAGMANELKKTKTQVINCTRQTALQCFEKQKLEDVL